MAPKCIFDLINLVSARETVFDNKTDDVVFINVYAEDPKSKKQKFRHDLKFELQPQSKVRQKISKFCFQEVNPERWGILIAVSNGKQAKIPGASLRTTAAFVFNKGKDGIFIQPIKESSTDISRLRMFACIRMKSADKRLLEPIQFEQGNASEVISLAYPDSKAESEADDIESFNSS